MRRLTAAAAQRRLADAADPALAKFSLRFFRTGPGEYGEGDKFRGIKVPVVRQIARDHRALPLPEIAKLLASRWHEDRLLALAVLAHQAERAEPQRARELCRFYLDHRGRVNNWDLVDMSAHVLVGPFLAELGPTIDGLSRSSDVWDRRIAILAHMHELRKGEVDRFYALAPRFLDEEHDLIHKAVGWLLREAGKSDPRRLVAFLEKHGATMPRTMLRYAIEKLPVAERKRLMAIGRPRRRGTL